MQTDNQRQLNSEYKLGTARRIGALLIEFLLPVVIILAGVLATSVLALAIAWLYLPRESWTGFIEVFAGLVLAFVVYAYIWRSGVIKSMSKRNVVIRANLEQYHPVDLSQAFYVRTTPGNYRIDITWDTGYLLIVPGSMEYYGERACFDLTPEQVVEVRLAGSWWKFWSYPYIRISWRETPESLIEHFSVAVSDSTSIGSINERTAEIRERIESWKAAGSVVQSKMDHLGLPRNSAYSSRWKSPLLIPRVPVFIGVFTQLVRNWFIVYLAVLLPYSLFAQDNLKGEDEILALLHFHSLLAGIIFLTYSLWAGKRTSIYVPQD